MKRSSSTLILIAVGLLAAGCGKGSSSTSASSPSTATTSASSGAMAPSPAAASISTRSLRALGTVLVDGRGHTLYTFAPDKRRAVTCTGACAAVWPPLKPSGTAMPSVSGAVKRSLLGSYPDPEGGRVVTYAGWPLYEYAADTSAGTATGQALNINGGLWYAISPSGTIVTAKP